MILMKMRIIFYFYGIEIAVICSFTTKKVFLIRSLCNSGQKK